MKKTFNINLGGIIFHIDDDAFNKLEAYLSKLRSQFNKTSGGDEILNDVETRMAELFRERITESKQVINMKDLDEVISIMGRPEDYLDEESSAGFESNNYQESYSSTKKIHRDVDNRIIGGVSSGLAAYFNIDPLWVRLLFIVMLFAGFGFLLYLILWVVVPAARTTTEKLQMRGKPVTLSNIENFVKEEGAALGASMSQLGDKARHYNRGGQSVLAAFFSGIFSIIRLIFRFIFKVIGIFFLVIGIIILISFAMIFFIGVKLDGYRYNLSELGDMIQLIAVDSSAYNGIMIGSSLLFLGPLLLLIYYGLRIIFGIEPLNSGMRRGIGLLSLAGFITLLISGIQVAQEFDEGSTQTKEYALPSKNGMIYLDIKKDEILDELPSRYRNKDGWKIIDGRSYFTDIELDVRRSSTGSSYLVQKNDARGYDRDIARLNAQSTEYNLAIDTGMVMFDGYFTIPKGTYYRAQRVILEVYLAKGDTLYFGEDTKRIIDDIDNVQNIWDPEMVEHYWIMTDRGLYCIDCEGINDDYDPWEDEFEDEIQEGEIKRIPKVHIEDDMIRIEEREVYYQEGESQKLALMQSLDLPYQLI